MIGYGVSKIFILNIMSNKSDIIEVNKRIYKEIVSLKFASKQEGQYKCFVACLKKGINQIVVFDIIEYLNSLNHPLNKLNAADIDQNLSTRILLNFS